MKQNVNNRLWKELNPKLIFCGLECKDAIQVLEKLGSTIYQEGMVTEQYTEGLIKREKDFPTGLDIKGIGVAMPHTGADLVKEDGFAVAVLKKPVKFRQMGTDDRQIDVQLVFIPVIREICQYMEKLQDILKIIRDRKILEKLLAASDKEEIIRIIREKEEEE